MTGLVVDFGQGEGHTYAVDGSGSDFVLLKQPRAQIAEHSYNTRREKAPQNVGVKT